MYVLSDQRPTVRREPEVETKCKDAPANGLEVKREPRTAQGILDSNSLSVGWN